MAKIDVNSLATRRRAISPDSPRRALRTVEASRYCGISASLLRKLRLRGPSDPGPAGPPFIRLSENLIIYEIAALDAWINSRAAAGSAHIG